MIEATLIFIGDTIKYRDLFIKSNPYGWHVLKNDVSGFDITDDDIVIGVSDIEDAVSFCKKYYDKLKETK